MFDIEELVKQVSIDISVPSKKFVYFDKETGLIKIISSKKINEDNFIEVETNEIIDIVNGTRSTGDFLVKYDHNFQKYIIHDSKETAQFLKKDAYLYEIPKYGKKIVFKHEYKGIHVDVWYQELPHLKGQHIWYKNSVYRLLKDLPKNTKFYKKNAELIIDQVKLYNDSNQHLNFNKKLIGGDLILDHNKIYSVHYDSTIKRHYDKDIDLQIIQNKIDQQWSISLSKKLKTELKSSNENLNKSLIFGITSKEDPNCLHRLFKINLKDLADKSKIAFEYQFDFEFENKEVSIYTSKYFKEYSYRVVE